MRKNFKDIIKEKAASIRKMGDVPWKDNILTKINIKNRIFRIIKFDYLLSALKSNKTSFSHPKSWSDPYDSIFIQSDVKLCNGALARQAYKNNYFVQCWCYQNFESDAMWRIYSSQNNMQEYDGVMILSTPEKIMNSLWVSKVVPKNENLFLGKIQYIPKSKFKDSKFFANFFNASRFPLSEKLATTLLLKTNAYKHENELRFIVEEEVKSYKPRIELNHNIPFSNIIDKIIIDPRASRKFRKEVKSRIDALNFKNIRVFQSTMLKSKDIIYDLIA